MFALVHGFKFLSAYMSSSLNDRLNPTLVILITSLGFVGFVASYCTSYQSMMLLSSLLLGVIKAPHVTAANLIVAQASTQENLATNTGIYYALFRCSRIVGNTIMMVMTMWDQDVHMPILFLRVLRSLCFLAVLLLSETFSSPSSSSSSSSSPFSPTLTASTITKRGHTSTPLSQYKKHDDKEQKKKTINLVSTFLSAKFYPMVGLMATGALGKVWLSASFSQSIESSQYLANNKENALSLFLMFYGVMLIIASYCWGWFLSNTTKIDPSNQFPLVLPYACGVMGLLCIALHQHTCTEFLLSLRPCLLGGGIVGLAFQGQACTCVVMLCVRYDFLICCTCVSSGESTAPSQ